ncbi:Na+/H+ antiporter NhaC [Alkalihalobacillus sp. 1P02AB]|uniref:Na+/H+ antiporter NhaC n=1 Tax=Alkalihalobacillus sp. 1P02AB TaxID=3132260 RepID=UPI0039A69051
MVQTEKKKNPSFFESILMVVLMLVVMVYSIFYLKVEPHLPLLISLILFLILGFKNKYSWSELEESMIDGIKVGLKPLLILAIVGMIIAVWMLSGTVPTLIYYGLQVISPQWFTISALMICILVSTFTGSSFTTVGTIGVAMFGIGTALGIHPALVAGAVISGACFGDKMSPLSDTTNFAAGIAGIDLFEHIKHLCWTMIPALLITVSIYLLIGNGDAVASIETTNTLMLSLQQEFKISWLTLLSPLIVVLLAVKKKPTIFVLIVGVITGILTALFVQGIMNPTVWLETLQSGYTAPIANETIAGIVNRGGLQSMMWSISLVMIALALGGVIQKIGLLDKLLQMMISKLKRQGDVIAATASTSIAVNTLTGEQYLSVLIPGKLFPGLYEKHKLHRKNLARTLEDAGTLVNPLIPWGISGAFFASVLGVSVVEYFPYAIFLFISPILTIAFGYLGIGISTHNE